MKTLIASTLALALAGCATATPVFDHNGQSAMLVDCGANPISTCFEKANQVCPLGYRTMGTSTTETGGAFLHYNQELGTLSSLPTVQRQIVVACK